MGLPSAHPGQHKANRPQAARYPPAQSDAVATPQLHGHSGTMLPVLPTPSHTALLLCALLQTSQCFKTFLHKHRVFFIVNSTSRVAGV